MIPRKHFTVTISPVLSYKLVIHAPYPSYLPQMLCQCMVWRLAYVMLASLQQGTRHPPVNKRLSYPFRCRFSVGIANVTTILSNVRRPFSPSAHIHRSVDLIHFSVLRRIYTVLCSAFSNAGLVQPGGLAWRYRSVVFDLALSFRWWCILKDGW